jgi:hypothetical protein
MSSEWDGYRGGVYVARSQVSRQLENEEEAWEPHGSGQSSKKAQRAIRQPYRLREFGKAALAPAILIH